MFLVMYEHNNGLNWECEEIHEYTIGVCSTYEKANEIIYQFYEGAKAWGKKWGYKISPLNKYSWNFYGTIGFEVKKDSIIETYDIAIYEVEVDKLLDL